MPLRFVFGHSCFFSLDLPIPPIDRTLMNSTPKCLRPLQLLALGSLVVTTSTMSLLAPGLSRSARAALQDSPKALVDEAWQWVNHDYVDGTFNKTDWKATRQELLSKNYTSQKQAYDAIRAALKRLDDPYTRFMDPGEFAALTTQTSGELSGVGIRLGVDEKTKILTIVEPIANSPATKAGIQSGDQLLEIDGKPTSKMSIEQASSLIRGKAGTPISLSLSRPGKGPFKLNLTRAIIELPTVSYSVKQEGSDKIGYIRLSEFNAHAPEQVEAAIKKLQAENVKGYVFDLRGNPGGLLQVGVDITRMWLNKGMIVRTVDRGGKNERIAADRTALTQLPLAILVDNNSASCSEIMTGALKDNRRATVIGTQTFGKALVQSVHPLSDGSGLAVTIAHYYTPSGTDINHKGIAPDLKVELSETQRQALVANPSLVATSGGDPQYAKAVASLKQTIMASPKSPKPQAVAPTQPIDIR
jgi:carboxyl-terminal processing protease